MRPLGPLSVAAFMTVSGAAFADTVAVGAVCSKEQKVCNKDTAHSVYKIPVQGTICFVPIQQKLADLGVYDSDKDDIRITCETKSTG